jgi:hypothetical protein
MSTQFPLLRRPSNEATNLGREVAQAMTCGYSGRFAGPKRRWQIQAVIVMTFMNGTAVGGSALAATQLEPLPCRPKIQIRREIGQCGR